MAIKVATSKLSDVLKSRPYIVEGDGVLTTCPIHADGQEANPSLRITINEKGGLGFTCRSHGCHKTNFLDILRSLGIDNARSGWTYGDIETNFANGASEPVTAEHIEALRLHVEEINPDQKVLDYVRGRWGLTYDDVANLGIGKDKAWTYSGADHRAHRVFVPFYDFHGIPRGGQARATSPDRNPRWSSLKNPEGHAWSRLAVFDRAEEAIGDWFIITEGPGDGLTAYAAGFSAASIRGATLASDETLSRALKAGTKRKTVVIAGDQDEAGRKFVDTLLAILPDALVLPMPKGIKDLSEWYEGAPDGFSDVVLRALRNAKGRDQTSAYVDEEEVPDTDLRMARAVLHGSDGLIKYVDGIGMLKWADTHWSIVRPESLVTNFVLEKSRQSDDWKRWERATAIAGVAKALTFMDEIALDAEKLDSEEYKINVLNGTFDVTTGELLPHNPKDLFTSVVPFEYHEDAKAERWDQFIEEVFPHEGLPQFMKRLVGYGITGSTREEVFCISWGDGSNGKSKFQEALAHVFNPITVQARFDTFVRKRGDAIPADVAAMRDARLVFSSEGNVADRMDEALIKGLTGGDAVTARFMRENFFTYRPKYLIMIATNHRPRFRGQDNGLWRRILMIPFTAKFEGESKDVDIPAKLRAEAEGILAWALHGATEWYRSGLGDRPDVVNVGIEDYREDSNTLDGFLPGWVEFSDSSEKLFAPDVWKAYQIWSKWEMVDAVFHDRVTFYDAVVSLSRGQTTRARGKGNRMVFHGLKWVGPEDDTRTLDELLGLEG